MHWMTHKKISLVFLPSFLSVWILYYLSCTYFKTPEESERVLTYECSHWGNQGIRVPGEIKRREVELDPQVSPEEITSREVELGCESWTFFASGCSSAAVQRTLSLWLCPSTAVETAFARCTSHCAMARQHCHNTSIVLAAVHSLSGLFQVVSAVEPSLFCPLPPPVPVPNKQPRLVGCQVIWSRSTKGSTVSSCWRPVGSTRLRQDDQTLPSVDAHSNLFLWSKRKKVRMSTYLCINWSLLVN